MFYTENQIPEEALPSRAGLINNHAQGPHLGLSVDEIQDRLEFIRCYLLKEFEVLLLIPKQDQREDFFIKEITVTDPNYSAFNTMDYQRIRRPFDTYGYAMRKIMDRIQDLATLHSSISGPADREMVKARYETYLDSQFRDRLAVLMVKHQRCHGADQRNRIHRKIAEIQHRIRQTRNIWARYAPPENWDP